MPAGTIRTPPSSWAWPKCWSSPRGSLRGNVLFIFQPAEEGAPPGEVGGASEMLKAGIFEKYKPEVAFGLHAWASLNTGIIGYRGGPFMAGLAGLETPW